MKKLLLVVSLCFLLAPVFAFASIDNNLYYGLQQNSDVKQLQEFLIDKGFLTGSATGNFFSLTLKAVKAYQTSVGISSTGYVGNLTRTAINNELVANLSASNQEATTETGTTPPTPTPPATTSDVVATLQAQIALLTQQLQAMLSQQTTTQQIAQNTQQIAQNTQQIVQNTTPPACTPNWQCGSWNTCTNSQQTRTCNDSNSCNTTTGEPILTQACTPPTATLSVSCSANSSSYQMNQPVTFSSSVAILGGTGTYLYSWTGDCVGSKSTCSNSFSQAGTKTANLTVNFGSQTQTASCSTTVNCTPNWQCTNWSTCSNSTQTRSCSDSNSCGVTTGEPILNQSCAMPIPATLATPTLVISSPAPSQYIISSAIGSTNSTQATYSFVSNGGASTITELKFNVAGSDGNPSNAVTNICVGSVCVKPVSGTSDITSLNLAVPNGVGLTQNVTISYAPVGTGGIISATTASISLVYVGYTSIGVPATITPNVSTPMVYLVGSLPTVTVSEDLSSGMMPSLVSTADNKIGQVTVAANAQGAIGIHKITFSILPNSFPASFNITTPTLDIGTAPIAGVTCTTDVPVGVTCTFGSDLIIQAGQSQTLNLYAYIVSSPWPNNWAFAAYVKTSLTPAGFIWNDTSTNGGAGTVDLTGSVINNFPTNSYQADTINQ